MDKRNEIRIKDALFPAPFAAGLEFNAPVHGTWNIVHIGMQFPMAHQIYICADNCMRGVVMTAAEMGMLDRISGVVLSEEEMVSDDITKVTLEGISELLHKFDKLPRAIIVFPVCVHHFLSCDMEYVYSHLEEEFPDVIFMRAFMDPIMQKLHLTPEQTLRRAMLEPVKAKDTNDKQINILGCDMSVDKDSELYGLLISNGFVVKEIFDSNTVEDYMDLGAARLNICNYPTGDHGVKAFSERCNIPYLYLPMAVDYDEIDQGFKLLCDSLGINMPDYQARRLECDKALDDLKDHLNGAPVAIDYTVHPRPFGIAYLLLKHGINVTKVFADKVTDEEKDVFEKLQKEYPDLVITATITPGSRRISRNEPDVIAVGQKAAWFCGTKHFVNMVEGGGLLGYEGILKLAGLIADAYDTESDTEDIVPRKGLGCVSCI